MIRNLRFKFIIILMSVTSFILIAIFASMLISTQSNNRRISEDMLLRILYTPAIPKGFRPTPGGKDRNPVGTDP